MNIRTTALISIVLFAMSTYASPTNSSFPTNDAAMNSPVSLQLDVMLAQSTKLEKLIQAMGEWERDGGYRVGAGSVSRLQAEADRYVLERQSRKKIEAEALALIGQLKDWAELWQQEKALVTEEQEDSEPTVAGTPEVPQVAPLAADSFSYYEVKSEATLQEISALPEVYGNQGLWRALYNSNTDRIAAVDQPVPAGTVLVVPDIGTETDFKFE